MQTQWIYAYIDVNIQKSGIQIFAVWLHLVVNQSVLSVAISPQLKGNLDLMYLSSAWGEARG